MKNKIFLFLIFFSFLSFYIFNSEKCVKVKEIFANVDVNKFLKYNNNYFYDISIIKPNLFDHIYIVRKNSIKLFSKCSL
jgi:hypothetical protein